MILLVFKKSQNMFEFQIFLIHIAIESRFIRVIA